MYCISHHRHCYNNLESHWFQTIEFYFLNHVVDQSGLVVIGEVLLCAVVQYLNFSY